MTIENGLLSENEKVWINTLLIVDFDEKDNLINQINSAQIEREYTDCYLSIKFSVSKDIIPAKINIRVPIEMRVFRKDASPIQFLLHLLDGYIAELEIFCADSSKISSDIKLENIKIFLADELQNAGTVSERQGNGSFV